MASLFSGVRCLSCQHRMPPDPYTFRCERCGSVWMDAVYDSAALPSDWSVLLRDRPTTLWRYEELLPFSGGFNKVTIGEGWTPLVRAEGLERELGHREIWIKDERQHATGSFKDRQASVAVSALKAQKVGEVVLASTGNAAAAYAAYCARADIKLWVFLTSSVPAEKMRELALYGAEVIKVSGTYDQAKQVAADFAERRGIYLDRGAKSIPCKESMKTIAFEIAEQMGWQAPDWYVQAVSGGIGPLGVLKGFLELKSAGIIDRVPKIGVVQTEGCSPMVRSWEKGLDEAEPVEQPDSLITVLATGKPGMAYQILKQASEEYGGAMVAVSDGEAFRAMRRIARLEGFSMEPAASVAFAGVDKLIARGFVEPGERVVVNCSGHTFSAEKYALEDRYILNLTIDASSIRPTEGLVTALEELDEQITTVVIIDDNPYDSRLIRRLLQNYKHYRVFEANCALDGLDLIRQRQPDLVVLDLMMPEMDGFAVLDELKNDPRTSKIPVVVVSAKTLASKDSERLQRYAESVWQKGNFSARELIDHVVGIVEREEQEGEPSLLASAEPVTPQDQPLESFGQGRQQRVLIIDDYIPEARLMRRLLEARQRFEVLEAYSGKEALEILEQTSPDLVILDLLLPDINGEDLLMMLRNREETRRTPVIVVTSKSVDAELRSSLGTNVDAIWSKSMLDRSSFLAQIETLLSE